MKKETEIQWRLSSGHPNIAQLYCFFYDDEHIYCVMEFAPHGNLYQKLRRRGPLEEREARSIIQQIVSTLHFCSVRNVIHRDIKPENILVFEAGEKSVDWRHGWIVKLCDFGWATHSINQSRMTFCGTPDYLAPELVSSTPYDDKVDVWAVGVLTYELLTGASPFDPSANADASLPPDPQALYRNIKNLSLCYNRHYEDHVSDEAKAFIGSILQVDPRHRMSLLEIAQHPWLDQI